MRRGSEEKNRYSDWRQYERFVASLYGETASDAVTVIPNAKLIGAISGVPRQIDCLIDARVEEDLNRRIIIDAKRHKRKIDVLDVEALESLMRDCRAHRGILVCPAGFTAAAKRRAQENIGLKLVSLEEVEQLDLTTWEPCIGSCSPPAKGRGLVLYDQPFGLTVGDSPLSTMVVGKCDGCGNFHVWCWECGSKFALPDEGEHHCCGDWFWLTAIEDESDDLNAIKSVLLLLVKPQAVLVVDRRPLA